MKSPISKFQTRAGFTLVELLTVIAIIAILMGILLPTINSVIENAKKVQAKNDELQIVNAVKGFYTEYGKYPLLAAVQATGKYNESNNDTLFNVLRVITGLGGEQLALNPRKIVFMEVPAAKKDGKPGIQTSGKWCDPWGYPYRVWIDYDYDNKVSNPYSMNAGFTDIDTGVIAFSVGRDGKGGTGDKISGDSKDDVISWQ